MCNVMNDQIEEARHDIEAIESYIVRQRDGSLSADQIGCLRGLQDMYRQRIAGQPVQISKPQASACPQ